jgi:hypothetical protein
MISTSGQRPEGKSAFLLFPLLETLKTVPTEGEAQASTQLAQTARVIGEQPNALQLRYLQTLTEIAVCLLQNCVIIIIMNGE